jgi:intracellular sulfur oxidation DsrE/DsrF family protein
LKKSKPYTCADTIIFVAFQSQINFSIHLNFTEMANNDLNSTTDRRGFLGSLATGAAAVSLATLTPPLTLRAAETTNSLPSGDDPEKWFDKIKGRRRVVYDVTEPHEIFPFAWPRVFLITNEKTGTPAKDCSVVVVLRHAAIGYAMHHELWAKYNLGEVFKANDPATGKPAIRNPFWKPEPGAFSIPGVGAVNIGINELQADGVMFCVCDMALTVYSAAVAEGMNKDGAELKKEWVAGLLPGMQIVPSGVWALGRAQEKKCAYIFAS